MTEPEDQLPDIQRTLGNIQGTLTAWAAADKARWDTFMKTWDQERANAIDTERRVTDLEKTHSGVLKTAGGIGLGATAVFELMSWLWNTMVQSGKPPHP